VSIPPATDRLAIAPAALQQQNVSRCSIGPSASKNADPPAEESNPQRHALVFDKALPFRVVRGLQ
jgi:hypothetical protein